MKFDIKRVKKSLKRRTRRPKINKTTKPVKITGAHSFTQRIKQKRDAQIRKRAEYLASLPKNPIKRLFFRLHPKRVAGYIFSRRGAISILKVTGIIIALLVVLTLALFAYVRRELPKNITELKACSQGASTLYYDRSGQTLLWASSGDVECYPVKLDQISPYLSNAVIAAEDKNFYKHGGFSMSGIFRAFMANLRGGETAQGGSTITQQFVKNSLLTQERTVIRKLKELVLSIELERSYTKDEILNAYLNEIPFGSVFNGAEAAAKGYFNKSAKDLTLDEATMLAAIIPAPTYYSPYGNNKEALIAHQQHVLDLMVEQGFISREDADAAKKVDVLAKLSSSHSKYKDILAPHFVLEVQTQLEAKYGAYAVSKAGYKVTTTLDLKQQDIAERAVKDSMYKVDADGGDNAAMVSIDVATNQVLSMVGSRDFYYPQYGELNIAVTPRSPGSSFKPYDYASLMTQTKYWGAGSTLYDLNSDFGWGYRPKDYDFKEPGALSMRYALGGSRNTPAIKAMYMAGIQSTIDLAKKMGITHGTSCEPDCGLSSAIGDGSEIRLDEHVSAFATFSRMGKAKPLTYILEIKDIRDKVIEKWQDTPGEQVLDPEVAYIINNMLSDDNARYMRWAYNFPGMNLALKTGTTNNADNGWLLMYSTKIAAGAWVGHHENKAMWCGRYGCMEGKTGAIVGQYMREANTVTPIANEVWQRPDGVKTVCIDRVSGYATNTGGECDIFPSWYIPRYPDNSQKAIIDIISNKLATQCTPEAAKKEITGGGILSEVPSSDPLYNNWLQPIMARYGATVGGIIPTAPDDIHSCDSSDLPNISVVEPVSWDDTASAYAIYADVSHGKYPLNHNGRASNVNFKVNGTIITGGSMSVSADGTVGPVYYEPENDEPFTITVEIIDSVLYSNSNTASVTPATTWVPNQNPISVASNSNRRDR